MASQQKLAKDGKDTQTLLRTTGHQPQQRMSKMCQASMFFLFLGSVALVTVSVQRVGKGFGSKDATWIHHSNSTNVEILYSVGPKSSRRRRSKCSYAGFVVPADFGFMTGDMMGSCNDDPHEAKCAITQIAPDRRPSGQLHYYIAGLLDGDNYKMVKFNPWGVPLKDSGRYHNEVPASVEAMRRNYDRGTRVGNGYKFMRGDGFLCPECNIGFHVSAGFGSMTGSWMGSCNDDPELAQCAITHVAKDEDGDFIGGLHVNDNNYFKMVKFNSDGAHVKTSGKYYRGGPPASVEEMIRKYHKNANGRPGNNYKFVIGSGFSCHH